MSTLFNPNIYSATTGSVSSSVTIYGGVAYPSNTAIGAYPSTLGTTSSGTVYPTLIVPSIKRCRNCSHAHLAEQTGCIDVQGWNTVFVACECKEYLPKDNLEYLEYLSKKQESH